MTAVKKYISAYLAEMTDFIEKQRSDPDYGAIGSFLEEYEHKLTCFMHERLIHLIVTVLFALLEIMSFLAFVMTAEITVLILCGMFLVLLVPYVFHYYFLENSVQKLYKLKDELVKIKSGKK